MGQPPTLTITLDAWNGFPADVDITPADGRYVGFYENMHGEQLVYLHNFDERPVLYHSDIEWKPCRVAVSKDEQRASVAESKRQLREQLGEERFARSEARGLFDQFNNPLVDMVLDEAELAWLYACTRVSAQIDDYVARHADEQEAS